MNETTTILRLVWRVLDWVCWHAWYCSKARPCQRSQAYVWFGREAGRDNHEWKQPRGAQSGFRAS